MSDDELAMMGRWPGAGLEQLRRRLIDKDDWMFDEERFADAVATIGDEFVDGVLAAPYDGSMMADRAISGFISRWIDHFITAVELEREPPVRSAYVRLSAESWHQVSVLKFVHQYFILDRPDLAMFQRGQARTIEALVTGFDDWLSDRLDAPKAPRRLIDLVRIATEGYERVAAEHPDWLGGAASSAALARMGRGRGIADFVSSLTDQQAVTFANRLGGARELLWSGGAL
jgi:dGTPase